MGIAALRAGFPVAAREVFLNHAAVGPISTGVAAAMTAAAMRHATDPFGMAEVNQALYAEGRHRAARLVGGTPAHIAYIDNTSHGISLLANGLGLTAGDNVVVPAMEFPSNTLPWLRLETQGVELRRVAANAGRIAPETVAAAMDRSTRVVTMSHVQYWNGHRSDIAAIGALCQARGALFIVDGTQSVGAMRIDMAASGIDALVVSAHKWMLGPLGIGFMALSEAAMARVAVTVPGWLSVEQPFAFRNRLELLEDARRFEPGTENAAGRCGLVERLREIDEFGIAAIEARILGLNAEIGAMARRHGAETDDFAARERSGIMTFAFPGQDNAAIAARLLEQGIRVSLRHGRIRVSPHYYNDETDIAALSRGLAAAYAAVRAAA